MIRDRLRHAARRAFLWGRACVLPALHPPSRCRLAPPDPTRVSRLLVVRTDRLGDMALTGAALQDLRDHFRGAEITVLAPPAPLALLQRHPAVDRRVVLQRSGPAEPIRARFDLAIDFTPDAALRGALLVARTRAAFRAGFRCWGRQVFFNLHAPPADPSRHILDLNRDLVRSLG
ncbi:MAG: glycosyltransferase family 9 protein, partial [Planctomycetota bacterium]